MMIYITGPGKPGSCLRLWATEDNGQVFDVLETRRILDSKAAVTIVPANDNGLFTALLASEKKPPLWDDQDSDADKQPGPGSPPRHPRGL